MSVSMARVYTRGRTVRVHASVRDPVHWARHFWRAGPQLRSREFDDAPKVVEVERGENPPQKE